MTNQQDKKLTFPFAFEIYSYDVEDCDNWPADSEYPYSSEQVLEILLHYCLDHCLMEFIVLIDHSIFTKLFTRKPQQPRIITDNQKIKQEIKDILWKMITNQVSVLGVKGDLTPLLELFKKANWVTESITIEQVMADINLITDNTLTTILSDLSFEHLFFINHDGEPVYLIDRSNYMQAIA